MAVAFAGNSTAIQEMFKRCPGSKEPAREGFTALQAGRHLLTQNWAFRWRGFVVLLLAGLANADGDSGA